MDYTTSQVKSGQHHINGKFSADEVSKEKDSVIENVRKQAQIPGYRKGKVPKNVIQMRMGKEYLEEEVKKSLLEREWEGLVRKFMDQTVVGVDLVSAEFNSENEIDFVIQIDVVPEFTVEGYKGVSIEKLQSDVSEAEVEEAIQKQIQEHSSLEEIKDRPAKMGDHAVIEFEGFIDGKPFEGGSAKEYMLELGSNSFIEGFEEQIVGMNTNEEKDIPLEFPVDYHHNDFAGKPVIFKVKIHEIKHKVFPELNDDFAKECEFESLAEMKEKTRAKLEEQKTTSNDQDASDRLIRKIIATVDFDAPAPLVEDRINLKLREFEQILGYQRISLQDYCDRFNVPMSSLRDQYKLKAGLEVKSELILKQIFKNEEMEVTQEEMDKELEKVAAQTGRDINKLRILYSDPDRREYLKDQIILTKTMDFLVENADIQIVDKLSEINEDLNESEKEMQAEE